MKQKIISQPKQVMTSPDGRTFIPMPVVLGNTIHTYREAFSNVVSSYYDLGKIISDQVRLLLVLDGEMSSPLPGDWIIEFSYNENDGTYITAIYLAAELS